MAVLDFGANVPFVKELGFTLHHMQGGASELRYEARPEHLNSYGVNHGGTTMTLLDVTMAVAARSDTPELGVVTVEMKTSFMRPIRGPVVAKGRLLHRTRSLAFAEATLYDAEGHACGHATGTFKYLPKAAHAGVSTD